MLAHEVGHHVQNLLGISGKVHALQESNPAQANPLSVRLELRADCFAGIWANSTAQRNLIERSHVESGIQAAGAVGDDRLQRMARGRVSPESFTHGSSAQRVESFERGLARAVRCLNAIRLRTGKAASMSVSRRNMLMQI